MPVTPDEILDSAIKHGSGEAEVDWRNACSRAYFAAFHRCRQIRRPSNPMSSLEVPIRTDSFSTYSAKSQGGPPLLALATCSTNAEG